MSNIVIRTLSGAVYVALLVVSIVWHPVACAVVMGCFMLLCVHEYCTMVNRMDGVRVLEWYVLLTAALIYLGRLSLLPAFIGTIGWMRGVFWLALLALPVIELFRNKGNALTHVGYTLTGLLLVAVPFSLMNVLQAESRWLLLAVFVIIWVNDTFAYLAGMAIGKHRMMERVSPKKSWEGFCGGAVMAIGASMLYFHLLGEKNMLFAIALALLVVIFGTLGDFVESLVKRIAGVKDSSHLMPGHGGFYDRFDSALMATLAVYATMLMASAY